MDLRNFGQAIRELAEEKGVAEDKVVETIELAVAAAYKKDYGKKGQIVRSRFNPETGALRFSQVKIVVDESMIKSEEEIEAEEAARSSAIAPGAALALAGVRREGGEEDISPEGAPEVKKVRFNPERHIMLEEARRTKGDVALGEEMESELEPKSEFGRIASQTAKQVIIQRIREAEREATYAEFKDREGEIVSGIVQRIEGRNVFVDLGRGAGLLAAEEQIPRERLAVGERVKAIVTLVAKDAKGAVIFLSRSHPRFLEKLFELEVPEIPAGTVAIKAVAREPGSRSKIAVASNDPAVDPVGSMVGQRGVRVSTVINEIGGEKIDIIEWAEDPARFIGNALAPAKVLDVILRQDRPEARAVVPDDQLSLAIGKGGQNVRLAAKLTGWRIDVRSPGISPPETALEASPAEGGGVAPEIAGEIPAAETEPPEEAAAESGAPAATPGETTPNAGEPAAEKAPKKKASKKSR